MVIEDFKDDHNHRNWHSALGYPAPPSSMPNAPAGMPVCLRNRLINHKKELALELAEPVIGHLPYAGTPTDTDVG